MKDAFALLLLVLNLYDSLATVFEGNFTSCPRKYYNEKLNANNVFEVDLDPNIIREVFADYQKDVRPHLRTGKSTEDFCLVTPYDPDTDTWETTDKVLSDIKWYSVNNEKTYEKYLAHVDRLGIKDIVRESGWIDSDEITVYTIFLIPRSHSEAHQFHVDWSSRVHTQVMTFLVPLNDFDIHLKYEDNDDKKRDYNYTFGKGIAFGGGFTHSTGIGHGEEEDVLLCVYLGSDDPTIWKHAQKNIGDELQHYMSPLKGFTRNERHPGKKCQGQ